MMGSRPKEAVYALLEVLWTRLAFLFNLPAEIFGDDLDMEAVSPLLATKALKLDKKRGGWTFESVTLKRATLASGPDREKWHPPSLTFCEFTIMNILCNGNFIDTEDKKFVAFLEKNGETIERITQSLNAKKLAALKNGKLSLIVDGCACMMLPDGRYVAAENKTGRLVRYAFKVAEEQRRLKTGQSQNADAGQQE